jgi:hypothetical protein
MFKKLGHAALASMLGVSMLFMPTEASAVTIPVPQRDASAVFTQQGDLVQNVQYQRRRYLRMREGRFRGDRFRYNRFNRDRGSRFYGRNWRGTRNWRGYRGRYYAGYPGYYYRRGWYGPRYYDYDRWDRGYGWGIGLPLIAGAAILGSGYDGGYYGGYGGSAHVRWCSSRYRSYNPRSNTWVGYSGRVYQCDSPYDRR